MCLSPITILNPTKYINTRFRDSFLLQVPCNSCAECMSRKSQEWQYRSYYEFQDCIRTGGYIYFDTLTYAEKHVPRIRDFGWSDSPDYCFNHKHITDFMKRLRIDLDRNFCGASVRYFLSSEYGTNENCTHRPHYHVLFFVHGVDLAQFSTLVAQNWQYGRTDGMPYRPYYYVKSHNYITSSNQSNILRACTYVTKYVQKSCEFQKVLDSRLTRSMFEIAAKVAPDDADTWLKSVHAKRVRMKLARSINQFHRQSLHYGESALADIDINDLSETGTLIMPSFKSVKQAIGLPTYYKRKLFCELVEIDGSKVWQLTDAGIAFKKAREPYLINDLKNRFDSIIQQYHLPYNSYELADYVLSWRGRYFGCEPSYTLENILTAGIQYYNYSTMSDREHLGSLGVTTEFVGNNQVGYRYPTLPRHYRFYQFINRHVHVDKRLEDELSTIIDKQSSLNRGKQNAYSSRQRLSNIYKMFV